MNKLLLIDLRTPFHVKEFKRLKLSFNFINSFEHLIIAPKELIINNIPGKLFRYSFIPTSYPSIMSIWNFVESVSRYSLAYKSTHLCTAVNFGPLHEIIINKIKITNGFLFEDGVSSYLDMDVNNYWIKKIFYTLIFLKKVNVPKKKFFSTNLFLYNKIFSDKLIHARAISGQKKVHLLKPYINSYAKKEFKLATSIYFLSSSSIEYGLQKFNEYDNILRKLQNYVLKKKLIVSFHHNEKNIKKKIELIEQYFKIEKILPTKTPAEEIIFNGKSNFQLIAPYNSTALSACYQPYLQNLILYNDNGPNISKRIELFKKILPLFNFRSNLL